MNERIIKNGEARSFASWQIMPILVGLAFFGGGIAIVVWGIVSIGAGRENRSWPEVTGTITQSRIVMIDVGTKGQRKIPDAEIAYKYSVDGVSYDSDTLSTGVDGAPPRDLVARYPLGKTVQVFHDPENPGRSFLETGSTWEDFVVIAFGFVVLAFGGLAFVAYLKPGRSD